MPKIVIITMMQSISFALINNRKIYKYKYVTSCNISNMECKICNKIFKGVTNEKHSYGDY